MENLELNHFEIRDLASSSTAPSIPEQPTYLGKGVISASGGTGGRAMNGGLDPLLGENLTSIITSFDDGGGTGVLREENRQLHDKGLIGVGDLRQALWARSRVSEDVKSDFNRKYDDHEPNPLHQSGQTAGNLEILEAYRETGDIVTALEVVAGRLGVQGAVLPISADNLHLRLTTPDGKIHDGEHYLDEQLRTPDLRGSRISFYKDVDGRHEATRASLLPQAAAKLMVASELLIGPGDLWTSLVPNLAVDDVSDILASRTASRDLRVMHVLNIMNPAKHTAGMDALSYLDEFNRVIGDRVVDTVIFNTRKPDEYSLREQAKKGSFLVEVNEKALVKAGYTPIGVDLLKVKAPEVSKYDKLGHLRSSIHHDADKITKGFRDILPFAA